MLQQLSVSLDLRDPLYDQMTTSYKKNDVARWITIKDDLDVSEAIFEDFMPFESGEISIMSDDAHEVSDDDGEEVYWKSLPSEVIILDKFAEPRQMAFESN